MADKQQQVAGIMREGTAAYRKGYLPQAINYFSQAAALDDKNEMIFNARSLAYIRTNRFQEALQDAEKVIQLKRHWVKGHVRKGQALMGLSRYEEAMMALMEGLDKDPKDSSVKNAITECRKHITGPLGGDNPLVNPFADFKLWEKVEKNPITRQYLNQPDYRDILQKLQKNPKDLKNYMDDARIMTTVGVLLDVEIEAPAEAAGDMASGSVHEVLPSGFGPSPASTPNRQGPTVTEIMDIEEVEPVTKKGLTITELPDDDAPPAAELKSDKMPKKNKAGAKTTGPASAGAPQQAEEAASVPKTAAELKALQEKEKGNAAYKSKDFGKAIEHYTTAIELDPVNMTFRTNRAAVYFEQHKYDECIKECESAIDVGRENRADFKLIAKALARIGNAYLKKEDLQNAVKYFEKSVSEHRMSDVVKKIVETRKLLKEKERLAYVDVDKSLEEKKAGNEAFAKGDYPTAIKFYNEAILRNPQDCKIFSNRAACYTKLAEFSMAAKDADECIRLDPTFVKGYLRKGGCLFAMKDFGKAKLVYQKAMEIDPNCQEAIDGYRKCSAQENDPEAVQQRVMNDPEIRKILQDPGMQTILSQMQQDTSAVREHLKDPVIAEKIQKLIDSGLIRMQPM